MAGLNRGAARCDSTSTCSTSTLTTTRRSDAFTRYARPASRIAAGVQWVDAGGRPRLLVGGTINRYIPNPTFDPASRPGALYRWYRGNPDRLTITEAFGELEPVRPAYRDRNARLAAMDGQGVGATLLFPTLGVGIEEALKDDPEAAALAFSAFNRWLEDDWGYRHADRIYAVPYISMLDPDAARTELARVLDRGAIVVNIRNCPFLRPVATVPRSRPATTASGASRPRAASSWPRTPDSTGTTPSSTCGSTARRARCSGARCAASSPRAEPSATSTARRSASCCSNASPRFASASVENGASWIPDLLHRLRDAANRNPTYFRVDPVESFLAHVWATPFWEDDVAAISAFMPIDRLLLGSDWPHAEGVVEPGDFVDESLAWADAGDDPSNRPRQRARLLGVSIP